MDNKRGSYEYGYAQGELARLWLVEKIKKAMSFLRGVITWKR